VLDNHSQKLLLKAIKGDCEVNDVDPDEYFWQKLRIGFFGE